MKLKVKILFTYRVSCFIDYSWQNALVIISVLVSCTCFCGALMRPLKPSRELPKPREKNMLDRLVEQTKAKIGLQRSESIYSADTTAKFNGEIAEVSNSEGDVTCLLVTIALNL